MSIPIFITVRDRVSELVALVSWLERAGHDRIILLDNNSTYEPCRYYLDSSPHQVVSLGQNLGSQALWRAGFVPDEFFVLTDPDCVPTERCPLDLVEHLRWWLDRYPVTKVAAGLYLSDVPETMPYLTHERQAAARHAVCWPGLPAAAAHVAMSDTTFALYRPGSPFQLQAIRTGPASDYLVRHLSWYLDRDDPDEETAYYLSHARGGPEGSSWKDWPR